MVYKVTYNSNRIKLLSMMVKTAEEFRSHRAEAKHIENVRLARQGDDKAKRRLTQFVYTTCGTEDGLLKGATRPTDTVMVDFDHIPLDEMHTVRDRILSLRDTLGLLILERSVGMQGYHVGFLRRWDMTYEQNLTWAAQLIGLPYDKNAKDITRVFFATTNSPDDLIFLDPRLFAPVSAEARAATGGALPKCPMVSPSGPLQAPAAPAPSAAAQQVSQTQRSYHGIPFGTIIAKYFELFNDGRLPEEGERNAQTYALASTLAPICDYSQSILEEVVPLFAGLPDDERRRTIASALNKDRKGIGYKLKQVIDAIRNDQSYSVLGATSSCPPPMPKQLPPLIRDILRPIPRRFCSYVAEACFPALGTYLHGV